MDSAKFNVARKQQKKYPELDRQVEKLNLMKEILEDYVKDAFTLIKKGYQDCTNFEYSGKPYDYHIRIIEYDYQQKIDNVMKIFDEFVIENPFLIIYGSEEHNTLRYCRYGESSFRLAIKNQIMSVKELQIEFPYSIELNIRKRIDDYVDALNAFYQEVNKVKLIIASAS